MVSSAHESQYPHTYCVSVRTMFHSHFTLTQQRSNTVIPRKSVVLKKLYIVIHK